MILLATLSRIHQEPVTTTETFIYRSPDANLHRVNLAGTFNNWSTDHDPMTVAADGKTWALKLSIPFGRIQYKFVLDGSNWIVDPSAPSVPDGNGHTNSIRLVLPPDYSSPASSRDGVTATSALFHAAKEPTLNYDRGRLELTFRARPDDLSGVTLIANGKSVPMTPSSRGEIYEYYKASLSWDRKSDLAYRFKLQDGSVTSYYGAGGFTRETPEPFRLLASEYKPFTVPAWVDKSVIYQIFPDRFADGDKSNDPANVQPPTAKPTFESRFGGDVAGVRDHLDYLKDLGIGAVYFNPVFESPSNHRYDATDYLKIDPQFGTNEEFDDLTTRMHAAGIKTVMDFAFNHTATDFFAFQDIRNKGEQSPYNPWYFIKSYPVVPRNDPPYVAWGNYPSMPKLNVVNPETEKYLLGVVDYWKLHAGVDGLRLDAANEVDQKLWRDLRTHVKGEYPDTWIVGEDWGDATPWLEGDQWDSTMGYQFRDACLGFFVNGTSTASQFLGQLQATYDSYPAQVSRNLMNLLSSHDTPRFLTLCGGNRRVAGIAATVQLTWPGTPSIYYGEELGMEGGPDPDDRRMMDWSANTPQNDLHKLYRTLIRARDKSAALQDGDTQVLLRSDEARCFVYARTFGDQAAIIAVNASTKDQTISIPIPDAPAFRALRSGCIDIITGRKYATARSLSLVLPAQSSAVLMPGSGSDLAEQPRRVMYAGESHFQGHRSPSSHGAFAL